MAATPKSIDVEIRLRRAWVLTVATRLTLLIERFVSTDGALLRFAARFTRVDQLIDGKWRCTGRLGLVPQCDDCDDVDGTGCRCEQWSARRMEQV